MLRPEQKTLLSHLVGKAVYEILFPVARIFPSALIERLAVAMAAELRGLGSPPSTFLLSSADGTWDLEVSRSGLSLRLHDYQSQDGSEQFQHLMSLAILGQESHERVALRYSSAAPVERGKIENLLAERVVELLSDPGEEFTQEVSGTWNLGHYWLRYGIQALQKEALYLSRAFVSAENVAPRELGDVLCNLEDEGLRLLSWPITPRALREGFFPAILTMNYDHLLEQALTDAEASYAISPAPSDRMENSLLEDTNRERVELLVRKHSAEDLSAEDELRLEVLTERVRNLIPQVTKQGWQPVEDIATRLEDIEDRTRRIRTRYGLNG